MNITNASGSDGAGIDEMKEFVKSVLKIDGALAKYFIWSGLQAFVQGNLSILFGLASGN